MRNNITGEKTNNRKRMTAALCVAMLLFSFPVAASAAGSDEYIKVGLRYASTAVSECVLQSDTGFQLVNITGRGPEETLPLPAYNEVRVTVQNGNIVLKAGDGTLLAADMGSTGAIMPLDYAEGEGTIRFGGSTYRDGIFLTINNGSTLNVINYITLEHYLYGVLQAEMGQSSPMESLKAQAVVARSFANLNVGTHGTYGFDVCTTTHCQVYKGFSNEYPSTTQAVDETAGETLYSKGKAVQAYYYKNSGGHTQNSEDVWSGTESHLRGVADPYSPVYPWTATMTFSEIKTRLEVSGYSPGTIQSVAVTKRNAGGAVSELTIEGSSNTVVLAKEKIRTVLGATVVKSTMFNIGKDSNVQAGTGNTGTGQAELSVSNGSQVKTPKEICVESATGSKVYLDAASVHITNGKQTTTAGGGSSSDFMTGADKAVTGGMVYFAGRGYGHGVGMPQDSAINMGSQGFSYDEILQFFFTGIEIY